MNRRGFFATVASAFAACCPACAFGSGRHAGAVVLSRSGETLCFTSFDDPRIFNRLSRWEGWTFTDETRRELNRQIAISKAKLGDLA